VSKFDGGELASMNCALPDMPANRSMVFLAEIAAVAAAMYYI
jgi:hypothetical protein